jgi:hypothetical protein
VRVGFVDLAGAVFINKFVAGTKFHRDTETASCITGFSDTAGAAVIKKFVAGTRDTDTASYITAGTGVSVSLALAGAQDTVGAGLDSFVSIENLSGSSFNDTLTGDTNANLLDGAAGDDTLDGGDGNDTVQGGAGSDTLVGGAGNDSLDGGVGIDTASYAAATSAVTVSLAVATAQAIGEGRVIGWFQGAMEFGPRALGTRSMVAAPTDKSINDWFNARLERSEFMPFAPSALAEYADQVFENVESGRHAAEFMTITFDVRPEWRTKIPAVVHVDGTARPQLVRRDRNPKYWGLIERYRQLSGIPLVLNTSFNENEPVVCKPEEALDCFLRTKMDLLVLGNRLVRRVPPPAA